MDNKFKNKKVLIFGLGLNEGGVGSTRFFASLGARVRITDLKNAKVLKPSIDKLKRFPDIEYTLGEHENKDIDWADLIIKNPAVKPNNSYIEYATKIGKRVEMDMGIFLEHVNPSQIIGVTGTKGKSTTTSLIFETLKAGGEDVIVAGNIGKSVLDITKHVSPNSLVALEISSFQLEAFDKHGVSPRWAVITNITPDHLNYYSNMKEYVAAKRIIGKYQTAQDFLFLRKNEPVTTKNHFLKGLKGQIIYFSADDLPKDFHPNLLGQHNRENIAAALSVAKIFKIPQRQALQTMAKFKGVPFRMELIKTWNGVKIINDTTATSPEAGIQAIKTASHIGSGNVVLVCGGMNKGMDYKAFTKVVSKNCKKVFFLEGDATDLIRSYKPGLQVQIFGLYNDLEKLLSDVKAEVKPGDIVLFSPAATSFNLFQNEFDRGRKFNEAVQKVFK
ncbi:MAG: UDP-N-acetylmuramoyl-L-alanine--D-glutamate ligase [Candidatus Daviesbacteria bacterium]|nr:UDP-N-acetylmuramoyl-L-alanine--D-glutamate ligase [Candidatus Daviesbacteria bacterium]